MKRIIILILFFYSSLAFADGLKEGFEVADQAVFNGVAALSWIGDTRDFKIASATWPYGSTPEFSDSHSLRSRRGSILNSTILTDVSGIYKPTLKMRWEIFVSGGSVSITSTKGFALILFVDSNEAERIESGNTFGYRIRLADPSGSAYPDGLYFEKANGLNWSIIDSVHTGRANINMGWKIVVERDVSGRWTWGFNNGLISNTVTLNNTVIDNEFTEGNYAGIYWYSIASSAGGFGCDEFIVNPYTPGLWKNDATSNDWNTSSNWDNEEIPDANTDVVIAKGVYQPELSVNIDCNNLTLEPGSGLIIKKGSSINITGDLRLRSDSIGNASFIDNGSLNVGGKKIVECYLNNSSGDIREYHFFSSPVSSQNVENYFEKFYVYGYSETQASWYGLSSGDQLEVGKGYSVYNTTAKDTLIYFEGEFNTGDIIINLSNANDRWNLIGNPFPSIIDWDLIDKSNIEPTAYMWNPNSLSYSYYNNGVGVNFNNEGLIGSMQAFFVRAISSGELIVSQNSRSISESQTYLKNLKAPSQLIKLSLTSGNYKDETVIRFLRDSKTEFEISHDAIKLLSEFSVPQIYSTISGDDRIMSINTLPEFIDSCEVELEIKIQKDVKYSIQIEEISGFEQNNIYIDGVDFKSDILLSKNDTIWISSNVSEYKKLKLKIKKRERLTAKENLIKHAYQRDGLLIVGFKSMLVEDAIMEIYSLDGRQEGKIICRKGQQEVQLPILMTSGIYIININTEGINHSKKINLIN